MIFEAPYHEGTMVNGYVNQNVTYKKALVIYYSKCYHVSPLQKGTVAAPW